MELTLVRHGVTEWNAQRRFQGQSDLSLAPEGRAQAALLAERLSDRSFDRIYSSDLRRALETARAIAEPRGLELMTDPRLREFAFGTWEGRTWAEILAAYPHLGEMSYRAAHLYAPDGGEDFETVCARVRGFFDDVLASGAERVAVVTHAGALHAALGVMGLVPDESSGPLNFSPCSITRVARENGVWTLVSGPAALQ